MKLNPDCIRDIMLTLEDRLSIYGQNSKGSEVFRFDSVSISLLTLIVNDKYGHANPEIVYSALQLIESGYIATDQEQPVCGRFGRVELGNILYITPKGHEFLASIYEKETWKEKISPILGAIGNVSLSIIESVAKGIADAAISKIMLNPPSSNTL